MNQLETHFTLAESTGFEDYFNLMEHMINELKVKYKDSEETLRVMASALKEIKMNKRFSSYYVYVFYIVRINFKFV